MTAALNNIRWHSFLARPALASRTPDALAPLAGQTILITGAGGSIGSALAMRLAALSAKLVLLEASEGNLYTLLRDWPAAAPTVSVLGSVTDQSLLDETFALHQPRIVFHAAAFKHVPLMEQQPLAAIANNIFGAATLAHAAASRGARVVLLSTDKAVEPASVMGATKRVAEQIVLSDGGTALRLGNVLASRGSVAEVFARQIASGGPLTVTSPSARRYFLTLDEAVNLLLSAALLPPPPTSPGTLFAPSLPTTHTICALAAFMTRELAPGQVIPIQFTGLRAGDKETELLWAADEQPQPSTQASLLTIHSNPSPPSLHRLRAALDARDVTAALDELQRLVPHYAPGAAVLALAAARVHA